MDEAISKVLEASNYISGTQVAELEEKLAAYVGVKHCITCGNGTDALTLALMTWGIGEGDAVFVPDFTFFSSAETSMTTVNKIRIQALSEQGDRRAIILEKVISDSPKMLSTILIGNNIVNMSASSLMTTLTIRVFGNVYVGIATGILTLLILIFGEITPKSIAKDTPERFALFSAPFIRLWIWVLTPLNFLFSQWKRLVSRFFKTDDDTKMSHEELLLFMEDVEQDGSIDENEGELLRNALEFRDLTAAEILTHRIDLEAVNIDESHEEISRSFTQSRFSRLLVYRDTIDQIVGVLHQKDFYINGKMTDQPITEIMTEPLFVYQHTKIRDILKMLQHKKSHVAVVVDDFGGTLGIVTMEDILEELVGEIWDEHDEVEEDFEKLDENTYRVDCSVSLEDFMEFFDVKLESDSVSVGGWVMEQLNRVPTKGDSFAVQNLEITVSELSAYRVSSITVKQCDPILECAQ